MKEASFADLTREIRRSSPPLLDLPQASGLGSAPWPDLPCEIRPRCAPSADRARAIPRGGGVPPISHVRSAKGGHLRRFAHVRSAKGGQGARLMHARSARGALKRRTGPQRAPKAGLELELLFAKAASIAVQSPALCVRLVLPTICGLASSMAVSTGMAGWSSDWCADRRVWIHS
jgi:hypothetical protein